MSILIELSRDTKKIKYLTRPLGEAVFAIAILRKAKCADISTLSKRICCQKIIYFANRLGIPPIYNFSLYVHGPYSSTLARDLFTLENEFNRIPPAEFIADKNAENFAKLDAMLHKTCRDSRKLEVAATLDFFRSCYGEKTIAVNKTIEMKIASKEEIEEAKDSLKEIGLW